MSINSFPHPPTRVSSVSVGPLPGLATPARKSRAPLATPRVGNIGSSAPSLLNGSAEGKSVYNGPGIRTSDGLTSIASPTQSRSSSAQESYSTSATTYDDPADGGMSAADKRASKGADGKGNVLVSVRVRPDAATSQSKSEGEWLVDGRRSLISYHGRDAGDYYYGKRELSPLTYMFLANFLNR